MQSRRTRPSLHHGCIHVARSTATTNAITAAARSRHGWRSTFAKEHLALAPFVFSGAAAAIVRNGEKNTLAPVSLVVPRHHLIVAVVLGRCVTPLAIVAVTVAGVVAVSALADAHQLPLQSRRGEERGQQCGTYGGPVCCLKNGWCPAVGARLAHLFPRSVQVRMTSC